MGGTGVAPDHPTAGGACTRRWKAPIARRAWYGTRGRRTLTQPASNLAQKGTFSWGLARGERTMVAAGLAVAGIVVGVLLASGWWTLRTYRKQAEVARREQLALVGQLLANGAARLLGEGEVTGARRLIADAALQYDLASVRMVLGDGSVLADAKPTNITRKQLPETFPELAAGEATRAGAGGSPMGVTAMVVVPGRGNARLEIEGAPRESAWADGQTQLGFGAIATVAMVGLLGVYRSMRSRWRAVGAVADALRLEASGTALAGALLVGERFGPLAKAWNGLIGERDRLRAGGVMREAIRTIEERGGRDGDLRSACDAMWHGLLVLDNEGVVRYCNGAAAVLLGSSREIISGTAFGGYIEDQAAKDAIGRVVSGVSKSRATVEIERPAGPGRERTVLRLSVRPLGREQSLAGLVVVEDTTQQRVADESRNAFVAQATHELRTPLTNIRLYVETLVEDGESAQTRAKCLNVIGSEARRLERIVGDMLSVSEIEAGALKLRGGEVQVEGLLQELEADFRAQAEDKEIKLMFELPPKLPVMQADRDKLMLAMHNLVGNALKYTPAGGVVRVRVEEGPGRLSVAVIDNGIGINKDELELVFEKFFRAKDRRIAGITGSGIGLALARQVVRLHGGDITCESQIDKGSTFTLTVPLGGEAGGVRMAA